jgi:hypothetical protein
VQRLARIARLREVKGSDQPSRDKLCLRRAQSHPKAVLKHAVTPLLVWANGQLTHRACAAE